jgi:hypothetical protein
MAKRGRPPKDATRRKSEPVSIRLTPRLREQLEEERKKAAPERTLSQEIEIRVRESFELDHWVKQLFGGPRHYWLLRIIAEQMLVIEHQIGNEFLSDRFTFDQVRNAVDVLFDYIKPRGRRLIPKHLREPPFDEEMRESLGARTMLLALVNLELAAKRDSNPLVLTEFVDPVAAGSELAPHFRKSAIKEFTKGEKKNDRTHPPAQRRLVGTKV